MHAPLGQVAEDLRVDRARHASHYELGLRRCRELGGGEVGGDSPVPTHVFGGLRAAYRGADESELLREHRR